MIESDQPHIVYLKNAKQNSIPLGTGWFFYTESYDLYGPFDTLEQCEIEVQKYCDWNNRGPNDY